MASPTDTPPTRSASTRLKFLEAGARVFVEEGYTGTSMELVAKKAGLSRAALYKHFRTKNELFISVAEMLQESAAAASTELATQALEKKSRGSAIVIDVMNARRQRLRELLSSSAHATELMEESSRRCGPLIREHAERFRAALVELLERLASDGRLELSDDMSTAALADMLLASEAGLKSAGPSFLSPDFDKAFSRMAQTLLLGASRP